MDLNGFHPDSINSPENTYGDKGHGKENIGSGNNGDGGDPKDDDIEVSISKEDGVLSYGAHFTIEYHSNPLDSLYSGDPYESGDDDYNNNYNLNFMASQDPGLENGISFDILLGAAIAIPAKYLGLVTKTSPKIVKSFQSRRAALRDRGLPTSQTHISHKKNIASTKNKEALNADKTEIGYSFKNKGQHEIQEDTKGHKYNDGSVYNKSHFHNGTKEKIGKKSYGIHYEY